MKLKLFLLPRHLQIIYPLLSENCIITWEIYWNGLSLPSPFEIEKPLSKQPDDFISPCERDYIGELPNCRYKVCAVK